MTGALGGDPQVALAGELDRGGDVLRRLGKGNRGRPLIDGEVPRSPRFVKALLPGEHELAGAAPGPDGWADGRS